MEAMELNCKRDINFMYLLEGKPVPDYATFARFRSIHFAPCAKRILAEMSNLLYELGEISGESIFIDGTKIETCANKYTFVWKKSSNEKNQEKLLIKIADLIAECEQLYGIQIVYGDTVKMKHVKTAAKKAVCIKTGRKHCICTWYRETKNSAAKEYRNIRRLSGPFKRIYKKTAYLWKKEQLF